MNPVQHRNWLLTIVQLRAPLILESLFCVVVIVAVLTLFFEPIYSASTHLVIDDEISRVLGGLTTTVPSTTANDYIRYEWFASHSIELMRLPQFTEKVIKKLDLRGRSGHALYPEYFVEPSFFNLVYLNQGQGISVEWVTDTQTFAILGYSTNPDMAVTLSKEYSEAFLEENTNQSRDIAAKVLERVNIQIQDLSVKIGEVDQELRDIRQKYKTSEPTSELSVLMSKINSTMTSIEGEEANEALYATRMDYYKQQEDSLANLKRIEESFGNNSQIDLIKSEIRQLQGSLVSQAIDLTPDHPNYKQTQQKLELAQQQLKEEASRRFTDESVKVHPLLDTMTQTLINLRLGHLSSQLQLDFYHKLLAAMETRRTELLTASTKIINSHLKRDAMTSTVQSALKDQYRLENLLQKALPFFRVISSPRINQDNLKEYKYFPKRKKILIIAALVAAFLLFFYFVGKEMIDKRAYYSWQLDGALKTLDCSDVPWLHKIGAGQNPERIHKHIQDLGSSLRESRIVRVSSKYPGEGKATVADALASYYRRIGLSVILVDGDIVNRSLSRHFGMGDKPGLIDVLAGAKPLNECTVEVKPGVYLLPAGRSNDAVFNVKSCREILSQLAAGHDHLICVDPPSDNDFAGVSEAIPHNDAILVAQSGKHTVLELQQAGEMRRFNNGDSTLRWIVINKVPRAVNLFSVRDLLGIMVHPIRTARNLS
jgi:uncharacterized protein involved in exopolysaccharide biosynthesis